MNPLAKAVQWMQGPKRWGAAVVYRPSAETLGRVVVAHSTVHELPEASPAPGARGAWALWLDDQVVHTCASTRQRLLGAPSPYGRVYPPPLRSFAGVVDGVRNGSFVGPRLDPGPYISGVLVEVRQDTLDIPLTLVPGGATAAGLNADDAVALAAWDLARRTEKLPVEGLTPGAVCRAVAIAAVFIGIIVVGLDWPSPLGVLSSALWIWAAVVLTDRWRRWNQRRAGGHRLVLREREIPTAVAAAGGGR
jgi:hypothetical protein